MTAVDFVPLRREISAPVDSSSNGTVSVKMHDGSVVRFRRTPEGFDPGNRDAAYSYVRERQQAGEVVTGLIHIDAGAPDMHGVSGTARRPLVDIPYADLCPGSVSLAELMDEYR
jgi:2-oxoglutarate ferredoxin oxidoreductase subunit beta